MPYNRVKKTANLYQESIGADNVAYNEQKEYLEDLKFQMKLMFSEFDNGSLFSKKLNEKYNGIHFDSGAIFSNKPFANYLVDVNHLFIEFLKGIQD